MPITAVVQQEHLREVAQYLQEQLKPQLPSIPLQIQCALKDNLLILVQHPPDATLNSESVFGSLQQTLATLPEPLLTPLLPGIEAKELQVRLFLRALGQPKPYASHNFALSDRPHALATAGPAPLVTASSKLAPIAPSQPSVPFNRTPWLLAAGGIAAAAMLGGAAFVITRPCTIGDCQPLQRAQTLSQQSAQTMQATQSQEAYARAKQQLTEAQRLVTEIPSWSAHYGEAEALQQTLDRVLEAEEKAEAATRNGQVTAQSVTEWQAVQSLWREAIAQLEAVPQTSPLYTFAQKRLWIYRANLTFTNQRISAEQDAHKQLVSARKTFALAEARQSTAQQLQDWQVAQSTWQVGMNALRQVPDGTTNYAEAQQLLQSYEPKAAVSRDRASKEQQASKAYAQAIGLQNRAKGLQQQNQWSAAAASWRSALTYAKQIPDGTSLADQAQTLVTTSTNALKQAETVVRLRTDLDGICFTSGKICDYTIQNDAIKVRFTAAYERKVRTVGGVSWFSKDYDTINKVNKHFATLANALQAISNNSGVVIEVYDSDSRMVGSFNPGG